jgi:hypothetical protein
VVVDIFAHVKAVAMLSVDWKSELQSDTKFVTGGFQASQKDVRSDEIPEPQATRGRRKTGMTTEEKS